MIFLLNANLLVTQKFKWGFSSLGVMLTSLAGHIFHLIQCFSLHQFIQALKFLGMLDTRFPPCVLRFLPTIPRSLQDNGWWGT